jgi:outer membrane exchange protein TraA
MAWHSEPIIPGQPLEIPRPGTKGTFNRTLEVYMDDPVQEAKRWGAPSPTPPHVWVPQYGTLDTPLDLSNNFEPQSRGDFANCGGSGCVGVLVPTGERKPLASSENSLVLARLRGYLNITSDKANLPYHFGFHLDNAVSLTIFNNAQSRVEAIVRPVVSQSTNWRATKGIRFLEPGLYPIEIMYVQEGGWAVLEMSTRVGDYLDIEDTVLNTASLASDNFVVTPPSMFFQTSDGSNPMSAGADTVTCWQCPRQHAGKGGTAGCDQYLGRGYTCNSAAICERCTTEDFCGELCLRCGGATPYCAQKPGELFHECVECTADTQCPNGRCDPTTKTCQGCNDDADCSTTTGHCDLSAGSPTRNTCTGCNDDVDCPGRQVCNVSNSTCVECTRNDHCAPNQVCAPDIKQCVECNQNSDCERGQSCSNHACVTCSTNDSCAGNSCNCCPAGTQCAALAPGASPSCVECTQDSDCTDGKKCDPVDGRCVDTIPECNTSERCGTSCVKCPADRPFCFDGQVCVACRSDLECGSGEFCLSGECASCTTDRHCGLNCEACGKEDPANPNAPLKPFCLSNGSPATSACVGCRADADCPGGTCDPNTNTCISTTGCEENCAASGKVCNGSTCVECFADAHCPCGGTCDVATGSCTESCNDGGDCLGTQFCSTVTQQCEDGRRKPGTAPNGGSFCCETTAADLTSTGTGAFLAMVLVGFLLLYSRRSL